MADTNTHLRPSSMADSEKTATQSHSPSILDNKGVVETVLPSTAGSTSIPEPPAEKVVAEEQTTSKRNSQASVADEDDDFEYPTKWRLAAITLALCLSVFCMALVR